MTGRGKERVGGLERQEMVTENERWERKKKRYEK